MSRHVNNEPISPSDVEIIENDDDTEPHKSPVAPKAQATRKWQPPRDFEPIKIFNSNHNYEVELDLIEIDEVLERVVNSGSAQLCLTKFDEYVQKLRHVEDALRLAKKQIHDRKRSLQYYHQKEYAKRWAKMLVLWKPTAASQQRQLKNSNPRRLSAAEDLKVSDPRIGIGRYRLLKSINLPAERQNGKTGVLNGLSAASQGVQISATGGLQERNSAPVEQNDPVPELREVEEQLAAISRSSLALLNDVKADCSGSASANWDVAEQPNLADPVVTDSSNVESATHFSTSYTLDNNANLLNGAESASHSSTSCTLGRDTNLSEDTKSTTHLSTSCTLGYDFEDNSEYSRPLKRPMEHPEADELQTYPRKRPFEGRSGRRPRVLKERTAEPQPQQVKASSKPQKPCHFCRGEHYSHLCTELDTVESRENFYKEKRLCFLCGGKNHKGACRVIHRCKWLECGAVGRHHSALCPEAPYPITSKKVDRYCRLKGHVIPEWTN